MFGKSLVIGFIAFAPLLAQQQGDFRVAGASVLQHTRMARQALALHETKGALAEVGQALAEGDQIRAAFPATQEPVQVSLGSDFDAVSTIVPAKRRGSADRLKHNSSVSEVSGKYTVTMLNVSSARNHLLAAQTALNAGDVNAAGTDLAAVDGDVVTNTYNGDMPLAQAKDNLAIALARVRDTKYKDAILPLKSASRALDRFAHQAPAPHHAQRAEKLSLDMNAFAERIEKDHEDAPGRITAWLDEVTGWFNSGMAQ